MTRTIAPSREGPIRVIVDARIRSGDTGGVESVIVGLAAGISGLIDADDEYHFLTLAGQDEWIRPYLSGPASPLPVRSGGGMRRKLAGTMPLVAAAWRRRPRRSRGTPGPPPSDGTIERLGADVMHFTFQSGFLTSVPSIYHPHDLQHLHLPQFFTPEQFAWRERWYRALCAQASMVAVASSWTKSDVEAQYALPAEKVHVVPLAPPTAAYHSVDRDQGAAARSRLGVPGAYVLYPAQTWPHKNHLALARALALLRRKDGISVPLVAPGLLNEHYPVIQAEIDRLGITDLVTWLGFVSTGDLLALYAGARAVVIPTKFEAASAPLWEAFGAGVPAACSNVTSLPEQAGDAALVFDPDDVEAIASSIRRLWTDERLRATLVQRGYGRVASLSWDETARRFRAHYRRIAGRSLSEADRSLVTLRTAI